MTRDVVIRAEGLGKKYIIGHQAAEHASTLRDAIARTGHNVARMTRDILRGSPLVAGDEIEEFWALRDVNFEIRRGDVMGIIGHNGAGKSTLLKILSRITEPSLGRIEIRGRVASLLEVGTGFHPELTGRENIYLNGAILGMTQAEVRRKFDEIVDFADIERFLDTPVKRYSSGMYVRLGFSVAAHLEPEILIVDEVLAVGDADFQKRCLGRMRDITGDGRTVIFVSHNMGAIRQLCEKALLINKGKAKYYEQLDDAIQDYRESINTDPAAVTEICRENCRLKIDSFNDGRLRITGHSEYAVNSKFMVGVTVSNSAGFEVFETATLDHSQSNKIMKNNFQLHVDLPLTDLRPGTYMAQAYAVLHNEQWLIKREEGPLVQFEVTGDPLASSVFAYRAPGYGPLLRWHSN